MRRASRPGLALGLAILTSPAAAGAYVIDLNDARVVPHGSFEAELQPLGYYQTLVGDETHELVVPSMQMALGIAPDWDVLFVTRGFVVLDDVPDANRYSLSEQMLAFRAVLVHGAYSREGFDGPSLVAQMGVLLPGVDSEPGVGASVALLFAQVFDAGTLHLNAWMSLTRDRSLEGFFTMVLEGPADWPVRPQIELWLDLWLDGEPTVSGLLGIWAELADDFAIEGGVRVGGWDGRADLEVRASAWWSWQVWTPSPGAR